MTDPPVHRPVYPDTIHRKFRAPEGVVSVLAVIRPEPADLPSQSSRSAQFAILPLTDLAPECFQIEHSTANGVRYKLLQVSWLRAKQRRRESSASERIWV